MTLVLPGKTVAVGSPPSSEHQVNQLQLALWMQQFEALAASNGISYVNDSVAALEARSGATDGQYGLVLTTGAERGVYERIAGEWERQAEIPSIFMESELAELARRWAESATAPDDSDPTTKSAKTWAGEAEADADRSETEADRSATNATATDADATATAADRAATGVARTAAEIAASVAGNEIVTSLTDPVPADGTIELLATDPGTQIWEVQTGAWVQVGWLGEVLFNDYAALVASTSTFAEGTIIRTRSEGLSFLSLASGATDFTATTVGGVKVKHVESKDHSLRLLHRMKEQEIAAVAGCHEDSIRLGPQTSASPGLSDVGALGTATATPIEITTPAEAAAEADSGSGTYQDPYVISNRYLSTTASGLNLDPGLYINDASNVYHFVIENCQIEGWSRGLVRLKTAPGSVIELKNCRLDYGFNPNTSSNREYGIVNNADGDEVFTLNRGTRVVVNQCEIYRDDHTDRPKSASANGWGCSTEVYDSIGYGRVWWAADEDLLGFEDYGDRHLKVHNYEAVDLSGDGSNFGLFNVNAPGASADIQRIKVSFKAGEAEAPIILSKPGNSTRLPARRKPVVKARYINVPDTNQRGIDLQWFDEDTRLEYITVNQLGVTRRGIQFGSNNQTDALQLGIGAVAWRCRVNSKATDGGAFAENILHEHCDTMRFLECVVVNENSAGGDDAIEAYGAQGVWEVGNCVVINSRGQAVDSFTNNGTRPPAEFAYIHDIYGTCRGEAIQLTEVGGAAIGNILVSTGLGGEQVSQVPGVDAADRALVMAYSRSGDGPAARNIQLFGMMTNSWNVGDADQGDVFSEILIAPGLAFDTSNTGVYVQDFAAKGYNATTDDIDDLEGR